MGVEHTNEELFNELQRLSSDGIAPLYRSVQEHGKFASATYYRRFGNFWRATVRAGLLPQEQRPLTPSQYSRIVRTTQSQQQPIHSLIGLISAFTGLVPEYFTQLTDSWTRQRAGETIVTVPESTTASGDRWTFRLPEMWGDGQQTELPGFMSWYLSQYGSLDYNSPVAVKNRTQAIASEAGIDRPVRPMDLRTTLGVRMARRNAPARRIRRHLGLEHTNARAEVEDYFTWCEIHDDGFSHPDWDPDWT